MCFITPFVKSLWIQACIISLLVAFLNIVHQPLRSLVADIIPKHQLTLGFSVHLTFVGLGTVLGSAMPVLFRETSLNVPATYQPSFLTLSFFVAGVLSLLTGLVTCIKTKENLTKKQKKTISLIGVLKTIFTHYLKMPRILKLISCVQFLIWISYFLVFAYFALSIAQTIFGLPPGADVYNISKYKELMERAAAHNSICFIYFQISGCLMSFTIPFITKLISRKTLLSIILLCGGIGLLSLIIDAKTYYLPALIILGMGFTSSIGIHLAILRANLPQTQTGLNTGMLIVANCTPQIVAGLLAGVIIKYITHEIVTPVIAYSGIFLIIGAICNQCIQSMHSRWC
jgi:maltose/moltooligosaccharide transporter